MLLAFPKQDIYSHLYGVNDSLVVLYSLSALCLCVFYINTSFCFFAVLGVRHVSRLVPTMGTQLAAVFLPKPRHGASRCRLRGTHGEGHNVVWHQLFITAIATRGARQQLRLNDVMPPLILPMCGIYEIDDCMQDCGISSANALEILQSCTKPLRWSPVVFWRLSNMVELSNIHLKFKS